MKFCDILLSLTIWLFFHIQIGENHHNTLQLKDSIELEPNSDGVEININSNHDKHNRNEAPIQHESEKNIRPRINSTRHSSGYSMSSGNSPKENAKKIIVHQDLTPDVAEVNGWRLPIEVVEYALANDLSEDQLNEYEQQLIERERKDEIEFQQRRHDMAEELKRKFYKQNKESVNTINVYYELDDVTLDELEADEKLKLPTRRSRIWYLGFRHGSPLESTKPHNQSRSGISMTDIRNPNYSLNGFNVDEEQDELDVHLNRHLKSVTLLQKRPLSASDKELLRCIGLDTFVLIRFLRLFFNITFFGFLGASFILFPTYILNKPYYDEDQVQGYFMLTINRLDHETSKNYLWVCFVFALFYLVFILHLLWIEWETFLPLRFDFLANGDVENENEDGVKSFKSRVVLPPQDDVQLHLEQYRNSCIVEFIPDSHRRDTELFQFFDAVFPGQVKRTEVLLNTNELASLIKKRQSLIEKYERMYAQFSYENKKHRLMNQDPFKKPNDPRIRINNSKLCFCGGKMVKAFPHILATIKSLNRQIESEYKRVSQTKMSVEDRVEYNDIFHKTAGTAKALLRFVTGEGSELTVSF